MRRIVCGGRWTADGRWVVIQWPGQIVYDPGNGDPWLDLWDCMDFTRQAA